MKKRILSTLTTLVIAIAMLLPMATQAVGDFNVPIPANPHPFATILREIIEDYGDVSRAYLVTLDDDGTIGMLIVTETRSVLYDSTRTLFYIHDGKIFQINASELFPVGRYNRLMARFHGHTHITEIIYKVENGRLATSTRLEYFSDGYLAMVFEDDYDSIAYSIARREAHAEYAREKYGLVAVLHPNFGHMRNTEHHTTHILAMTVDCIPRIPITATIPQIYQLSISIGNIPVNFAEQPCNGACLCHT